MEKIKTAIIGTGKVADLHAGALRKAAASEFVAVWNRTFERAEHFARKYNVVAYHSIEEMIERAGVQAAIVGTTHPSHAETAIRAMRAGAHVLVEKPLAASLQDCDAMIKTAKETGLKLGLISQRRLYPPVQRIRQAIDAGKLDVPVLASVTMLGWRDKKYYDSDRWRGTWELEGGGVLVNQAPHQLDIFQWFMGDIDQVYGVWDNLNHPYIEVEDTAAAVVKFKSGALGTILVSNSQNPALYGTVHVFGKNGASVGVQTDGGAMFVAGMSTILEAPYNDIWTIPGEEHYREQWKRKETELFQKINPMEYFHQLQIQDFCESILKDRNPMITGQEGRKTVELFTAIYRSAHDNRPVQFPLSPEYNRKDFDGRKLN
ncbi:gfo/Idh/MocA family oxidoreductase [candidate division KSB1 bacterium]|nr:Gfo/Idh/MocA family oxidoreductase [candidate division KSB1 bacterium]RQW05571.1 MAG: gfo/Idh/MocA family oxidoreductase [candidate division KSB1 bacterium]